MKFFKVLWIAIFVVGLLFLTNCGDDDATNSPGDIPAELVGTWWYHSGIQDGVPITSYAEISFTDTSETSANTLGDDGSWTGREYYDNQVVFTQSGTFSATADEITFVREFRNGTPAPDDDTFSSLWYVNLDTLTMTYVITEVLPDTHTVIIKYLKE